MSRTSEECGLSTAPILSNRRRPAADDPQPARKEKGLAGNGVCARVEKLEADADSTGFGVDNVLRRVLYTTLTARWRLRRDGAPAKLLTEIRWTSFRGSRKAGFGRSP